MATKDEYDRLLRLKLLRKIFDYVNLFGNINIDTFLYYYKYVDKNKTTYMKTQLMYKTHS